MAKEEGAGGRRVGERGGREWGMEEDGWRKKQENNSWRREEGKEGKWEEGEEGVSKGPGVPGVACSRGRRPCAQGPRWHFPTTVQWWLSGSWYTGSLLFCQQSGGKSK